MFTTKPLPLCSINDVRDEIRRKRNAYGRDFDTLLFLRFKNALVLRTLIRKNLPSDPSLIVAHPRNAISNRAHRPRVAGWHISLFCDALCLLRKPKLNGDLDLGQSV
jgi:hypothetical protein